MVKLRTTINPTEELDVDDREAADLKAMGAVLDMKKTRATTDDGLIQAAIRQVTGQAAGDDDTDNSDGGNAGDDNQGV